MRGSTLRAACFVAVGAVIVSAPAISHATVCVVADSGGTAVLPPNCSSGYQSPTDVHMIISGLPVGTTVEIDATHSDFFGISSSPGGSLGGEQETYTSALLLHLVGTGTLSGYDSFKSIGGVNDTTDLAPRGTGSVQSFDTDMQGIQGQLASGDPDFDLLRVTAGTGFGMPSPGHTTLTKLPSGDWNVDSFFDITYRIDFVGHPGGPFSGMSGSTTGTIRMAIGGPVGAYDHLECFKMKDAIKLKGIVNLPTLAGTPYDAAGCVIGSAKKWCTPAQKVVVSSTPTATPMPGPSLTSDYVCYKIKCPKVDLTQGVQDQFGARSLVKMKQGELCVPAVRTP